MSNYDLNKHKKSDRVKWILSGIAFFLVIVTIVGMCLQLWGNGKVKPSEWFKHEETEQSSADTENEDNELSVGGATLSDGESNGMLLTATAIPLNSSEDYGVSALADNVYSLSVTYTPEDTTYQETTYSIAFKNPSSTWATGKTVTDYATVTQSEVGSKNATLTVLKPFSEQIVVTATNNYNTDIKATTTVDYVGAWNADLYSYTFADIDSDIEVICSGMVNGTISPEFDECFVLTFYLGDFQTKMNNLSYELEDSVMYTFSLDEVGSSQAVTTYRDIILTAGGYTSLSTSEAQAYWQDACSVLLNGSTPEEIGSSELFSYSLMTTRYYNGVWYSSYVCSEKDTNSIELADWSGFVIEATSATSNTSSIVTG